jgi:glycosyltransferase involved in cell wall biosynthesis
MSQARPLRIIQIFNRYLLPGGEEKSVGRIGEDLISGGHRVTRFWRASEEWKKPGAPPRWKQPFLLWNNSAVLDELQALHEKESADLWLLHNVIPVVSMGVYRRALELKVPIIQWLHNYRPISVGGALYAGTQKLAPDDPWKAVKESIAGSWNGRLMTSWLAASYALARRRGDFDSVKAWVAVSDEMRGIFAQAGWFPERLHSVRHSWHLTTSSTSNQDDGHFLFLGRMVEPKGVRFIVDLWRHPALRNTTLVMAGQGPLADELRGQSPPNVRWVGQIEGAQKQELISTCRAIVFPCLWAEPLSTVAYEAYERGKTILASDMGGMKEIIVEGKTGRLLPPGNAPAWLQALTSLTSAESQRLGQAGRAWLEQNVTPEVWNRDFLRITSQL